MIVVRYKIYLSLLHDYDGNYKIIESLGGLRTAGAIATRPTSLLALHVEQFKQVFTAFKKYVI